MLPHLVLLPILCKVLAESSAPMCTCIPPKTVTAQVRQAVQRADVVVAGSVLELRWKVAQLWPDRPDSRTMFRLAVMIPERSWKGDVADTLILWTPDSEDVCGYPFVEGERYLVFATRRDSTSLSTGLCTLTQPLAGADRYLRVLGAPEHRFHSDSGVRRP